MKNALLILATVILAGATIAAVIFDDAIAEILRGSRSGVAGQETETGETAETEGPVIAPADAGLITDPAPLATPAVVADRPPVDSSAAESDGMIEGPGAGRADAPLPAAPEPEYRSWKTREGGAFEGRLVWISRSGKSLRFERADGSSFLYSTAYLAPEDQDAVRSLAATAEPRGDGEGS